MKKSPVSSPRTLRKGDDRHVEVCRVRGVIVPSQGVVGEGVVLRVCQGGGYVQTVRPWGLVLLVL